METKLKIYPDDYMKTCSECGKVFSTGYFNRAVWQYTYKEKWQCSYTCYDHAILRLGNNRRKSSSFKSQVNRCEDSMKAQGKTILHPIIIKEDDETSDEKL